MKTNIQKCSKLFFVLGLMMSVKGYAQQDLLARNDLSFQKEYISAPKTIKSEPSFAISPSSNKQDANLMITSLRDAWVVFQVKNKKGTVLFEQQMTINKGNNKIPVFLIDGMEKGIYNTTLKMDGRVYHADLVKE